ncbi:hypothetical protein DICPUDRAFT_30237 [Dictyostelium purpureum]|uniref:Fe2OG dioxygenase domain-containing protein n=1 Tax=Dictyostelium purpureum TaxID=5786 RepID=F0ZF10_DICPU|nr:uncharacterized protein DICPUDRAFT_30237 [Dictyostelium purpureum]EGC37455.1 hypothetical protein DICPUDRAFT_30237 [Dictyostelium purpureum]|eukprot:XP_003286019.1 hypothetical protein DICPUDRAFT_30237 [Dictyostelium purpureum]
MIEIAETLPIIDISLMKDDSQRDKIADEIEKACREFGFFYISGHGISQDLIQRLEDLSKKFFALKEEIKMKWRMELAEKAWRGYFIVGGEYTSDLPDAKQGLYLGSELDDDHEMVKNNTPIHGKNLLPSDQEEKEYDIEGFRKTIFEYMDQVTLLGHSVMELIALSLKLPRNYFNEKYTKDPLILFRIFNYPSFKGEETNNYKWGVGEHSDYGLLTLLYQDKVGGLQVRAKNGWIEAPPIPGTFVCNIGDMLERLTRGNYRSTPHRVRLNTSGETRISFPLFFDPHFNSLPTAIEGLQDVENQDDSATRWDHVNLHNNTTYTYGEYLLGKIGKVFPDLKKKVL